MRVSSINGLKQTMRIKGSVSGHSKVERLTGRTCFAIFHEPQTETISTQTSNTALPPPRCTETSVTFLQEKKTCGPLTLCLHPNLLRPLLREETATWWKTGSFRAHFRPDFQSDQQQNDPKLSSSERRTSDADPKLLAQGVTETQRGHASPKHDRSQGETMHQVKEQTALKRLIYLARIMLPSSKSFATSRPVNLSNRAHVCVGTHFYVLVNSQRGRAEAVMQKLHMEDQSIDFKPHHPSDARMAKIRDRVETDASTFDLSIN